MYKWLVCLGVVGIAPLLIGADSPTDKLADRELAKLDGKWQVVSIEHESVKAPDSQTDGNTWIFEKGTLVTRTTDAGEEINAKVAWKVKFVASGKRKSLELNGDRMIQAIYLLDGDDLVVCGGKELPSDFATGPDGSGRMMWVLKRVK